MGTIHIKPQNKGLLHKKLGKKQGTPLSARLIASTVSKAKKNGNVKLEREAVFAQNAKKWKH